MQKISKLRSKKEVELKTEQEETENMPQILHTSIKLNFKKR